MGKKGKQSEQGKRSKRIYKRDMESWEFEHEEVSNKEGIVIIRLKKDGKLYRVVLKHPDSKQGDFYLDPLEETVRERIQKI